jgi:hypothetical protein
MTFPHEDFQPPTHVAGRDVDQRGPYEVLLGEVDALLTEWRLLVRPEPWASLPPARLLDSLPEILPRLIRLARGGSPQLDDDLRDRIASEHGYARREDAVPLTAVAEEWEALKRACAQVLARHGYVDEGAADALRRLDALIDDAIGYTLRGYYRQELDSLRGRGLERRENPHGDRRRTGDRRERHDGA